jgi:hypothetical protein
VGLFKITPSGEESLVTSCCVGGAQLAHDSAGNLFGITLTDGSGSPAFVYEVTPTGVVRTLYTFSQTLNPYLALAIDSAGNLYGTVNQGGTNGTGFVYKLTKTAD